MTFILGDVCHVIFRFKPILVSGKKMEIFKISSLITLFIVFDVTSALYFHIAEGERKCFIEEIPDDTTVIGKKDLIDFYHILIGTRTNACTFCF